MRLRVVFHELAELELNDAATYYSIEVPGLGDAFIREVERATAVIVRLPHTGVVVEGAAHRKNLRRFPYGLVYSVRDDHIRILAIASFKRRPFYWRGRQ